MKTPAFYLLCAGILFTGYAGFAQNISLGAKGGASIPNLTAVGNENPINTGYSSRLDVEAALFAEYKFSKLFSLQAAVEYSSQGGKKNGLQALNTPGALAALYPAGQAPKYLYADYKSEARMNYIMIPVLAKLGWDLGKSPFRFYVAAGPFASYMVSAKQVTSGESKLYIDASGQQPVSEALQSFDHTEDIKDQLYTFNFGIEGNVGLNYAIGRNNIFVEGGGNYGFLNIQKGTDNGKNNTGAGTVVVGYSYKLGK